MSRIGKKPVELPRVLAHPCRVRPSKSKARKGTRSFTATDDVTISVDGNVVTVTPRGKSKRARQQWGMSRTMVANLVTGVPRASRKSLRSAALVTGLRCRATP